MKPNIILITADDMNWDAVGAYGCPTKETTPNIDSIAAQGIKFNHSHINIAVCQPSRSAIMTGRYPHKSGGEGFHNLRKKGVPILPDILKKNQYSVGILGKVHHSTPYENFVWDFMKDMDELGMGRNPDVYGKYANEFIDQSINDSKPFFLMYNSHDPHRPFYGNDENEWYGEKTNPPAAIPSKIFKPDEIAIPGFLPDIPDVRLEISEYYSSVRRCDDSIGKLLELLKEKNIENNTIVIFLSDNGMAFPFAKTNCYLNSTRTPFIIRWPEIIKSQCTDNNHFISGIDILPTLLDILNIPIPEKVDGKSFYPILRGEEQPQRDAVFTQFHQTAGKINYPMRCIQTRQFGYIYNPWSNGELMFKNESQSGRSWNNMITKSEDNIEIKKRTDFFSYRTLEEFYDFKKDPDALNNLINDPDYQDDIKNLKSQLEDWMLINNDPALNSFKNLDDLTLRDELMDEYKEKLGAKN